VRVIASERGRGRGKEKLRKGRSEPIKRPFLRKNEEVPQEKPRQKALQTKARMGTRSNKMNTACLTHREFESAESSKGKPEVGRLIDDCGKFVLSVDWGDIGTWGEPLRDGFLQHVCFCSWEALLKKEDIRKRGRGTEKLEGNEH